MSRFCSENKETITSLNYNQNYETRSRKSCLPNNGSGFSQSSLSAEGMVNKADLDSHIKTLLSQTGATAPNSIQSTNINPSAEFANASASLRKDITTEYCFYYKRYMYILQDILISATALTPGSMPQVYIDKKNDTEKLNLKLNQILQILQALTNSRINTLKRYYGEDKGVNELNKQLDTTREELIRHSKLLKKNELEKDVKSAMVDYSIEKNSSSRNLLAIYGFMNIVAASLIFYLYRSSKGP
jgi:hypothetical protein